MPTPFPFAYLQPAVGRSFTSFWVNRDGIRTEDVRAYAGLAKALAHEDAVSGYDAMNEPACELTVAPCGLPPPPRGGDELTASSYWQYKTYEDPTTSAAAEGLDAESIVTPAGAVKAAKARELARASRCGSRGAARAGAIAPPTGPCACAGRRPAAPTPSSRCRGLRTRTGSPPRPRRARAAVARHSRCAARGARPSPSPGGRA